MMPYSHKDEETSAPVWLVYFDSPSWTTTLFVAAVASLALAGGFRSGSYGYYYYSQQQPAGGWTAE